MSLLIVRENKMAPGSRVNKMAGRSLRLVWSAAVVLVCLARSSAAPAFGETNRAMMYLAQYGYLSPSVRNPSSGHIVDEGSWRKAISEFQSFAGLNTTGELDEETVTLMSLPRCGVKDKVGFGESRAKRYALQGSRWRVKNLTYKISKYPSRLNHAEVDAELAKAFSVWSDYTDLTFTQKKAGQVHIEIRFEKGEHGDGDPFDGPGGTLAHAYFPVYGGDAHFDDAEMWSINTRRGTNLFQVAAHEFGHSLGLSHSDVRSALMAPFYRGFDPAFQLDQDDIQGIQALYGHKTQLDIGGAASNPSVPRVTTQAPSAEDPALCADPSIDTIFNSADGSTFVFKGDHYWRLTETGVAAGYPRLISRAWPGLPGSIDAAFTYKNGKTYFFKGSKYWRYNGQKMDGDYPKEISEGFTGIPDNIDAALVWSGNGKIYFYKGSKFWRFDPAQRPPVKSTYPKPLSNWEGIPDGIDAALQYTNGYTYFFKGGSYWRFNDRTFSVDSDNPAFPRSSAYWWLGCSSAPRGTVGGNERLASPHTDAADDDVGDIIFDGGLSAHAIHVFVVNI
ncbi:matrix metalloproteinase-14 isoform X2 [Aricia agestis]|uniref:matrix metalloproteinase-14 isoform X2 n=1 Tax=Aricia agestis TaxID=91739 RepID=UPI001C20BB27|nr:matrix metalloproteinase-14 isoform X2 [Aricia agestis]